MAFYYANAILGSTKVTKVMETSCGPDKMELEYMLPAATPRGMLKTVYLSLGSNLGDRAANLRRALLCLNTLGNLVSVSSFYETEPVEFTAQPWFLNCAVKLETEKMPKQLIKSILELERSMGRVRQKKKGPRNIDIDILLFGTSIVETKELTIPHLAMHQRRFVLEPLAEIAPEVRHPVFKRTIRELRDALPAGQAAKKSAEK